MTAPRRTGQDGGHRRVYLAGPFGFTEAGRHYLDDVVRPALIGARVTVLDPWAVGGELLAPALSASPRDPGAVIAACAAVGAANAAMIRDCDALLALVDGWDLDSGTCAEIGYAAALARPVIGLRTDVRPAGDVAEIPVNLQVGHFITASGGTIETSLDGALAALEARLSPPL